MRNDEEGGENPMDATTKIARILSAYLVVTGIGFTLSGDYFARMVAHVGSDPVLINLSGMVHFFIGITILVHHFLWRKPLQIAVSLFGSLFLLKGAFLIALPEFTLQTANIPAQKPWVMAIGFLLVGLALGYFAYFRADSLRRISSTQSKQQ
ncbi:MAG: hypothetical protein P8163_18565 [Candidatus Thiodiazotropha sp.]